MHVSVKCRTAVTNKRPCKVIRQQAGKITEQRHGGAAVRGASRFSTAAVEQCSQNSGENILLNENSNPEKQKRPLKYKHKMKTFLEK